MAKGKTGFQCFNGDKPTVCKQSTQKRKSEIKSGPGEETLTALELAESENTWNNNKKRQQHASQNE